MRIAILTVLVLTLVGTPGTEAAEESSESHRTRDQTILNFEKTLHMTEFAAFIEIESADIEPEIELPIPVPADSEYVINFHHARVVATVLQTRPELPLETITFDAKIQIFASSDSSSTIPMLPAEGRRFAAAFNRRGGEYALWAEWGVGTDYLGSGAVTQDELELRQDLWHLANEHHNWRHRQRITQIALGGVPLVLLIGALFVKRGRRMRERTHSAD